MGLRGLQAFRQLVAPRPDLVAKLQEAAKRYVDLDEA